MAKNKSSSSRKTKKLTANQREWQRQIEGIRRKINAAVQRGYTFDKWVEPQRPKSVTQKALAKLREQRKNIYSYATYRDVVLVPGESTPKYVTVSGTKGLAIERKARAKKAAATRQRNKLKQQLTESYQYDERGTSTSDFTIDLEEGLPAREPPRRTETQNGFIVDLDTGEVLGEAPIRISDIVLSRVEDMLENWAPDPRWSPETKSFAAEKVNELVNLLHNEIAKEGRDTVAQRLEANSEDVIEAVEGSLYGYKAYKVSRAINQFVQILKGGALDVNESAHITDLAELHYGYDGI